MKHAMPWTVVLVTAVSTLFQVEAPARVFPRGLGFELSGAYATVSPEELNDALRPYGFDEIDRMTGGEVGVRQRLSDRVGVILRAGCFSVSTNKIRVMVLERDGDIGPSQSVFRLSTVPMSIGVDYRVRAGFIAFALEVTGQALHVRLTNHTLENKSAGIAEQEAHWDAVMAGLSGGLSAGWNPSGKFLLGLRAGYRLVDQEDVTTDDARSHVAVAISGWYAGLFLHVSPWE